MQQQQFMQQMQGNGMNNPAQMNFMQMQAQFMQPGFQNPMQQNQFQPQPTINSQQNLQTNLNLQNNSSNPIKELLPRDNKTNTFVAASGPNIINIAFNASTGNKLIITDNGSDTVEQLLIKYVDKLGLAHDVIGNAIMFLYNGSQIDTKSQETIANTFQNGASITVYDLNGIIGA